MTQNHIENPLTLEQFRATKVSGLKDAAWCRDNGLNEESVNAAEYAGSSYILIDGENAFSLIIGNQEWSSANLAELEETLYREYYLPEVAGVPRPATAMPTAPRPTAAPSIDSAELRRRLFDWAGAAPGAASEVAYRKLVTFIEETRPMVAAQSITLNARQLRAAAELAFPEGDGHPDQFETVVTLCQCEAFQATTDENPEQLVDCPAGVYMYFNDMPDQGIQMLNPNIEPQAPAEASAG